MKIYLIGQTNFNKNIFKLFLKQEGFLLKEQKISDQEMITEIAGRICFMSFGNNRVTKSSREFIKKLIFLEHENALEHVSWSFLVTGVSRSFTHQFVRHRVGFSFSQLSQQYCDQSNVKFIEPKLLKRIPDVLVLWKKTMLNIKEVYRDMLNKLQKAKMPDYEKKELKRAILSIARSVLPNATETKVLFTANARAIRHFLKVRGSIVGDAEMRLFSTKLLQILKKEAPALFSDFQIKKFSDNASVIFKKD